MIKVIVCAPRLEFAMRYTCPECNLAVEVASESIPHPVECECGLTFLVTDESQNGISSEDHSVRVYIGDDGRQITARSFSSDSEALDHIANGEANRLVAEAQFDRSQERLELFGVGAIGLALISTVVLVAACFLSSSGPSSTSTTVLAILSSLLGVALESASITKAWIAIGYKWVRYSAGIVRCILFPIIAIGLVGLGLSPWIGFLSIWSLVLVIGYSGPVLIWTWNERLIADPIWQQRWAQHQLMQGVWPDSLPTAEETE